MDWRPAYRAARAPSACGRYPADRHPSPVEVIRKLGGQWPDKDLAVTMNRMRCKSSDGKSWTTVRVRELRERLGIAAHDPTRGTVETISIDENSKPSQNLCRLGDAAYPHGRAACHSAHALGSVEGASRRAKHRSGSDRRAGRDRSQTTQLRCFMG